MKDVIRIGDRVKIIAPEIFVRCGYDLTYTSAKPIVEERYKDKIFNFMDSLDGTESNSNLFGIKYDKKQDSLYQAILHNLAYSYVATHRKTGSERKIFTKLQERCRGGVFYVVGKRVVKTGLYDPPYSHQDYYGEWDCYTGGLAECKTHIILELWDGLTFRSSDEKGMEIQSIYTIKEI